jgi:hypothetical protein
MKGAGRAALPHALVSRRWIGDGRGTSAEVSRVAKEHETAKDERQIRGRSYTKNVGVPGDESLRLRKDHVRRERQPDDPQRRV